MAQESPHAISLISSCTSDLTSPEPQNEKENQACLSPVSKNNSQTKLTQESINRLSQSSSRASSRRSSSSIQVIGNSKNKRMSLAPKNLVRPVAGQKERQLGISNIARPTSASSSKLTSSPFKRPSGPTSTMSRLPVKTVASTTSPKQVRKTVPGPGASSSTTATSGPRMTKSAALRLQKLQNNKIDSTSLKEINNNNEKLAKPKSLTSNTNTTSFESSESNSRLSSKITTNTTKPMSTRKSQLQKPTATITKRPLASNKKVSVSGTKPTSLTHSSSSTTTIQPSKSSVSSTRVSSTINSGPNKYTDKIKSLENKLSTLTNQVQDLNQNLKSSNNQINSLTESNQTILNDKNILENSLENEKLNFLNLKTDLEAKELAANAQIQALENSLSILNAENKNFEKNLKFKNEQFLKLEEIYKNDKINFSKFQEKCQNDEKNFEKIRKNLSENLAHKETENESLMICLQDQKEKVELLTTEKDEILENFEKNLQEKFQKELERFKNPKNEIDSLTEVLKMKANDNKKLLQKIEELTLANEEINEFKLKALELEKICQQKKEELADQKARYRNLKFDYESLKSKFEDKSKFTEQAERQVEALEFKLDQMSSQIMSESQMNISGINLDSSVGFRGVGRLKKHFLETFFYFFYQSQVHLTWFHFKGVPLTVNGHSICHSLDPQQT